MKAIKIKNLSCSFYKENKEPFPVLKDISLEIKAGDFVVVLGISGCGKTTFLNLIAGLLIPPEGTIIIDNYSVSRPHFSRSYIFNEPHLLPWISVKENIAFGCKLRGDMDHLSERVEEFIKLMGLEGFANAYPDQLSSGMAQRVAIARSLISNPHILLLDEPFTVLDYYNRSRLQKELVKLWKRLSFTTVLVTHDIEEALIVGKKIVMLSDRPTQVMQIYELDSDNPRDIDTEEMLHLKIAIQNKFNSFKN